MKKKLLGTKSGMVGMLFASCAISCSHPYVWKSDEFVIYPDKVKQGVFEAQALDRNHIRSNYRSLETSYIEPKITFKFAINGHDNEMKSGQDHQLVLLPGSEDSIPLIKFGEHYVDDTPIPAGTYLSKNAAFNIRLDMRGVLQAFARDGYYTAYSGERIYEKDFKGVYVAGSVKPLIWDFDNLVNHPELQLHDEDGDGIYEGRFTLNQGGEEPTVKSWQLATDISAFPEYTSDYILSDALYALSLEEMLRDIEPDSTFRTGKEWSGVWTRDISYSILLSMAVIQPEVAKKSLMRKVQNQRIIQDTGTGGAYPVSTDRIVWAIAAWEIYRVTGDRDWLESSYTIIKNTLEDDFLNIYNPVSGLVKGESSFLDWREQTYPAWMQPADIFESENLGTNAVHYEANRILAEMAALLGESDDETRYNAAAGRIKQGMNDLLWHDANGYYGQYRYGRHSMLLSPRAEALGEALCVLFDVASPERQKRIIQSTPQTAYGIPCIYPQIPNIPPYHNNGIWPFVQAYWTLAAAKVGHEESVMKSIASIYRASALFLTNKENFVADNGDYAGTQINSSDMLWSLSGNIALVYKVFFGMDFQQDSLRFRPFVPKAFSGERHLSNFKYRNAVLDIRMVGHGNEVDRFLLDGQSLDDPSIPADLEGAHELVIHLKSNGATVKGQQLADNRFSLAAPTVTSGGNRLQWEPVAGATAYTVYRNGTEVATTKDTIVQMDTTGYAEYQIIATGNQEFPSFASEPVRYQPVGSEQRYEMEDLVLSESPVQHGYSHKGYIRINGQQNRRVSVPVEIKQEGIYAVDFRYANGNGPVNTDNKCAIRTLRINEEYAGTVIFPQRGKDEWSNWGYSNAVKVALPKGNHSVTLNFETPQNDNMNLEVNEALLDYVRLVKID